MKIALIGNSDHSIYNYRLELIKRLISEGHKISVISPYGSTIEELKNLGCDFFETEVDRHGTNPIKDFKLMSQYKKYLKQIKPDYVFTYTIKPNIYGAIACRSLKIPCIANITGLGTAVENGGIMQVVTTLLYKFAFSKIQTVFFQNEDNREFFRNKNIYPKKHKQLPGSGVNLDKFKLTEYPSDETIEFVFISRLMKEKGIDQYLETAKYITEKYPNTKFHICGACEKEYENEMENVKSNPSIIYHGMVKNVYEVIKNVHCTIHPTYYPEGLANVLLESLATGRPIITTDRAGCKEVVDDGVNGFIVKQRDTEDLIKQVEKFLALSNEERRQMGLNGRAKVEKEFDRNIVIESYLKEISND